MQKFEFGSRDWLAALEALFRVAFEEASLEERQTASFSICEVYTGAPHHLAPRRVIAWFARFENGAFTFGTEELNDVDMKVIGPYDSLLPIARAMASELRPPSSPSDITRVLRKPGPGFLRRVHDRLALVTA